MRISKIISNSWATGVVFAFLLAAALIAAPGFWHGFTNKPAALVLTPRGYVAILPGSTNAFTAQMLMADGAVCSMPSNCVAWSMSPGIGTLTHGVLVVTNTPYAYGWLNSTSSGLWTRVHLRISPDGVWNPDADYDRDGISDMTEITNGTMSAYPTLLNIKCRLH